MALSTMFGEEGAEWDRKLLGILLRFRFYADYWLGPDYDLILPDDLAEEEFEEFHDEISKSDPRLLDILDCRAGAAAAVAVAVSEIFLCIECPETYYGFLKDTVGDLLANWGHRSPAQARASTALYTFTKALGEFCKDSQTRNRLGIAAGLLDQIDYLATDTYSSKDGSHADPKAPPFNSPAA